MAPVILNLALGGGVLASCPGLFAAGKEPHYLLNKRLGGPQKGSLAF